MEPFSLYMDYLRAIRSLDEVSILKRERHLLRVQSVFARPLLDASTASELNKAVIEAARTKKNEPNGGHQDDGSDLRHRLGMALCCYFRWAHGEGFVPRNPYPKNPFRRPALRDAYHLTEEQVERLMEYCSSLSLRDKLLVYVLMDTGIRVSELCRVKITDIDFLERTLYIKMKKVDREKTPPFSEATAELLELWINTRASDWLFPSSWTKGAAPLTTKAVRARFAAFSRDLGFRVNPHALRHTAVSAWVDKAGQIPAMQFAGHVSTAMTNHYTHLAKTRLRQTGDGIFVTKK
jgi:integrase